MNILAIECSTPRASLCLAGEDVSIRHAWTAPQNHDAFLFPALEEALASAAPELILVGSGPGSYGGVRVALAAATGVAVVKHTPVVALCSWAALAEGRAGILSDAKRGGWTLRRPDGSIHVMETPDIQQALADGELIWSVEDEATLARAGIVGITRTGLVPTAQGLIDTWLAMSAEEQAACAALPPEPIYVRPPHITKPKHKPWEIHR